MDKKLHFHSNHSFRDAPIDIRIRNLSSFNEVTLFAEMRDNFGSLWKSNAKFKANSKGEINLAIAMPLAGTYSDPDSTGLFWSMLPVLDDAPKIRTPLQPLITKFTLKQKRKVIEEESIVRHLTDPEVERLPIRDEGLVGTMFLQKEPNKYPTIIVLGGSEGGLLEGDAALLASHGFNTFSLAYFGIEKLPSELIHIPIDYVKKALNWTMNQRDIDPNRIGIMGTSKGGELALLSASMLPSIKAVAGYVPSSVVYPGIGKRGSELSSWTYQGDEIPFAAGKVSEAELQQAQKEAKTGLQFTYKNIYLQMAKGQEKAEIPVEKINGPILLISGGDDQLWPSEELSDRAIRRLKKYGHRFTYEHITFPLAGHSIGSPGLPTTQSMEAPFGQGVKLLLGGTPKDNAHAQTDAWEKVKRFFKENL